MPTDDRSSQVVRMPPPAERRRLRLAAGVTVYQLALALATTEHSAALYEKGRRSPREPRLRAYARVLDVWATRHPDPDVPRPPRKVAVRILPAAGREYRVGDDELHALVDHLLEWPPQLPPPLERRRLREAAGVTLEDLAARLSVRVATVQSYEDGSDPGRPQRREAYAQLLADWAASVPSPSPAAVGEFVDCRVRRPGDVPRTEPLAAVAARYSDHGLRLLGNRLPTASPRYVRPGSAEDALAQLALGEAIVRAVMYAKGATISEALELGATWTEVAGALDVTTEDARGLLWDHLHGGQLSTDRIRPPSAAARHRLAVALAHLADHERYTAPGRG